MLRIRKTQARVLADAAFADRVAASVRLQFAPQTSHLGEAELKQTIRAAVVRAHYYGLTWESSVAVFAALCVVAGPDFDRNPVVRSILNNGKLSEGRRVELLIARF